MQSEQAFDALSDADHRQAQQAHLQHQAFLAEMLALPPGAQMILESTTRTIERLSPSGLTGRYIETEYASGVRTYRPA